MSTMVTGTQINVKSRIEASKLISTAPRTKVCHFCWCCRQSGELVKKQERNWSTFFKSFWKIKSSMASVVIKLLSCFLYCFLSPFFCPHFFQYPEVYDQFYYRHEPPTLFFGLLQIFAFLESRGFWY